MASAMTLGNFNVYGPSRSPGASNVNLLSTPVGHTVGREEFRHTQQSQILGPLYFPALILVGVISLLRSPNPMLLQAVYPWHSNNFMETVPMQDRIFFVMRVSAIRKAATIAFCLSLTGCPVTVKVKLTNESDSEIVILYPTGYESKILPGKTKVETYEFDCFRVKTGGKVLEFQQIRPPEHYFDIGTFFSTIHAVFTAHEELKIYNKRSGNAADVIALTRGCPTYR